MENYQRLHNYIITIAPQKNRGIIVAIVIIGGIFLFGGDSQKKITEESSVSQTKPTGVMVDSGQTIIIQGHQLSQGDLEIEVGTTVVWRNTDNLVGLPYDKHTVTSGVVLFICFS